MTFTVATPQVSATVQDPASVDAAISSRFSARAYLDKAVDRAVLQEVLEIAARAPSGTNTQPWKVYVLQGAKRDELVSQVCAAHDAISANPALAAEYAESYDYYPENGSAPTSTAAVNAVSAFTRCWRLPRATRRACTSSTSATSSCLTRPWA